MRQIKEIPEQEVLIYGDIKIRAEKYTNGEKVLKIYTDQGNIIIRPNSDNSIRIESTKKDR